MPVRLSGYAFGFPARRRRRRLKARYRKTVSKYSFKRGDHPRTVQAYTLEVQIIQDGAAIGARSLDCGCANHGSR